MSSQTLVFVVTATNPRERSELAAVMNGTLARDMDLVEGFKLYEIGSQDDADSPTWKKIAEEAHRQRVAYEGRRHNHTQRVLAETLAVAESIYSLTVNYSSALYVTRYARMSRCLV